MCCGERPPPRPFERRGSFCERTVRSTRAAEAVPELASLAVLSAADAPKQKPHIIVILAVPPKNRVPSAGGLEFDIDIRFSPVRCIQM